MDCKSGLMLICFTVIFSISCSGQKHFEKTMFGVYLKGDSLNSGFHILEETDGNYYVALIKDAVNVLLLQYDKDTILNYALIYFNEGILRIYFNSEHNDRSFAFNAQFVPDSSEFNYYYQNNPKNNLDNRYTEFNSKSVYFSNNKEDSIKDYFLIDKNSKSNFQKIKRNNEGAVVERGWYRQKKDMNFSPKIKSELESENSQQEYFPVKIYYYKNDKIYKKDFFKEGKLTKSKYY